MWTSKSLRKDLKKLEKLCDKEKDLNQKEYLSKIISGCYTNIADLDYSNDDEENEFAYYLDVISNFYLYYPFMEKYESTVRNYLKRLEIDEYATIKFSKKDLFELVHGFYNDIGGEIYDNFNISLKNAKVNFTNTKEECCGITFFISPLKKQYITIDKRNDDVTKLLSLTHEYAHSIMDNYSKNRYINTDYFVEIESLFFEILSIDYYNKVLNTDLFCQDGKTNFKYYYDICYSILNTRNKLLEIFNNTSDNYNARFEQIKNGENFSENYNEDVRYLISYMCAIELYELYLMDKDEAIKRLFNITTMNNIDGEYKRISDNVDLGKSLKLNINRYL